VITTRETGDHDREIGDHDAAKQVITMRRFVRSRWPGARRGKPFTVAAVHAIVRAPLAA
jgi:hypothetical protein